MILVVGATGILGSAICRRLRSRNIDARGLVRPSSPKAAELRALGVEIATGDMRSLADVHAAVRGAAVVISTATAMGSKDKSLTLRTIDRDGQLRLVDAARRTGVGHFIYVSVPPGLGQSSPLTRYKREVEAAVRASGMRWTILQPTVFMEVWLSPMLGWDAKAGKGTIVGPGTAPMNWISAEDVAEHAVRAVDDQRMWNRNVELGGPEALSATQVARIFEAVTQRPFALRRVPRLVPTALTPIAALFNEAAASGMSLMVKSANGEQLDTSLQREIGLPLVSVREYAEQFRA